MSEQVVETAQTSQEAGAPGNFTKEEPSVPPARVSGQSDGKFYTEDDIQAARQQEKDKLYRRLETMQGELRTLQEERERRTAEEAQRQAEAEEAARRQREDEMSAKELIAVKEAEWRAEQERLRQEIESERALRERESQFAELMVVQQNIMAEYQDRVAPELLDLISGNSPEEIRQSAEDMAVRTERILAQTQEAVQNARQQMPTARVTMPISSGTDDDGAVRTYTPEDIRNMSMADYAKHRARLLGQGASGGPRNRGLFG